MGKHSSVFERQAEQHNTIKTFKGTLRLKQNAQPVFMKARPMPYALKPKVEKNLSEAVNQGILKQVSTSQWASPIVVAP